ncbi:MAG TPA: aminotransferase class I/II-fold pyridoxal phosphate-dependent enzyme [Pyrinomonadaceae bacterium]|jgi:cystathionine beta-lyase/cystathionine gamma-synthase|nr:aminotransferase class I/II-fold pyridoxal phosphate-dependent enzyme [Pyrinomonadaceae bacterium]
MKKEGSEDMGLQTRVLHESSQLNETHAVTAPIWQTSTFSADSPGHLAELGQAKHPSEFYTRYGNPTHKQVEGVLAALEGGEAALVTGSGMGAIFTAVMTLLERGDHAVAQHNHYAGSTKLFRDLLPRWGIERTFVDQTATEQFAEAIRPNTKLIYIESPVNPLLHLTDLRAVAELARSKGITTIIDNTFATPVNQQPLKLGIDVVVHSATKYLGGHHDLSAGAIIASESFLEQAWELAIVAGAVLSPFDAWLLMRGIKTLGLRVERQNQNALALAQFLESHPRVERVNYPGLESHPQHALARRQMSGFTGMMSVVLKGDYAAAERFISALKLARCAVSLGGVETLVAPVAAMWSHQHSAEQRRAIGIGDTLVRISVGIEDERDLVADFAQALEK